MFSGSEEIYCNAKSEEQSRKHGENHCNQMRLEGVLYDMFFSVMGKYLFEIYLDVTNVTVTFI